MRLHILSELQMSVGAPEPHQLAVDEQRERRARRLRDPRRRSSRQIDRRSVRNALGPHLARGGDPLDARLRRAAAAACASS